MNRKLITGVTIVTMILAMVIGGSFGSVVALASEEPISIVFAHNWTDTAMQWGIVTNIEKVFEQQYPYIDVIVQEAPGEQMKMKVQVEVAGGTLPDVIAFWAQPALAQAMVEANYLLDIQEFFAASTEVDKSMWSEQVLNVIKSADGKNYVIPASMSQGYLLYNKNLFEQYGLTPPETFEEWKEQAKIFNENGIVPFATASNNSIPGHFVWSQIAMQYPGGIEDSNNIGKTCLIDTPAFLTAAKYIAEMREAGLFPKDTMASGQWDQIYALYGSGKAAMVQIFPFSFGGIKASGIDAVSGITHFPAFPNSTVDNKSFTIGQAQDGYVFNAKSWQNPAKRDAMIKFGEFLLSDESFKIIIEHGGPVAKNIDLSTIEIDPFYTMCFDFVKDMSYYPFTKGVMKNQAIVADFQNEIDKLFTGASSPEQFIMDVQRSMDENK